MTDRQPYFGGVNPDLLAAIPADARTLMEVGCGTGALGAEFLSSHPGVTYYGIELDEKSAVVARGRLTAVACSDVETDWNPHGLAGGSLDALVFGDVLEHLRDPWTALARLAGLLRDGGVAVACIPNIAHWSVVRSLLCGRFDYKDMGLLDRTHLRFFTLHSMLELVRHSGLTPVLVKPRRPPDVTRGITQFLEAAQALARYAGVTEDKLRQNLAAFQYVITAVKGAEHAQAVIARAGIRGSSTGSGPSRPA